MSLATDIITSLGGASAVALGVSKVWAWWTARDAAKLAAEAAASQTRAAADAKVAEARAATESVTLDKLLALHESQTAQAESRAEKAAERGAAMTAALTAVTASINGLAESVDDHTEASTHAREAMASAVSDVKASQARLEAQQAEMLAILRATRPS